MNHPERIFVIACGTLALDIQKAAGQLGLAIGTRFLPGSLHEDPKALHDQVQQAIDAISESGDWDRIVVGYGLCGRGTVGLRAGGIPLNIPRVHDCIALFLGGNDAFRREFSRYPGTYYVSAGWYTEKTEPLRQLHHRVHIEGRQMSLPDLEKEYGPKKARKIFDFFNSWQQNYQRAAYIDTGAGNGSVSADYARELAKRYGWKYETLTGDGKILIDLLTARASSREILVVPPGYLTHFDATDNGLHAGLLVPGRADDGSAVRGVERFADGADERGGSLRIGLGIDAGGTYTDAVIFDLGSSTVLGKNKALTTRWNFSIGIGEALAGLDTALLNGVELVAVSTTLATNAIVEGDGQKVGLLLMPPYGLFHKNDIPCEPKAVIAGQLDISGEEREKIDEAGLRRIAREMVDQQGVQAFAVSGFAGSINPEHELSVKRILQQETGCFVSCGHELSDLLNFRTRAETAVLNARIVPRLVKLLRDLQAVLSSLGVDSPVVVVKGDGSLMSAEMAVERPVETILSGPAASVAGARFLSGLTDAIVVDMGGTTTDTAIIKDGRVKVVEKGSRVGAVQTHVRALEIRTAGLGGDSRVVFADGRFTIGPRRVAPMSWLGRHHPGVDAALSYLEQRLVGHGGSSQQMQFFALAGRTDALNFTVQESRILTLLQRRPYSLAELAEALGLLHPALVQTDRLVEHHLVQPCGLTPTDLLHVKGDFCRWDEKTARRIVALHADLARCSIDRLVEQLLEEVTRELVVQLVKKQLDERLDADAMDDCEVCRLLMGNLFSGGHEDLAVRYRLKRPVIGIGAPVGFFLPEAAAFLETEAILSEHADVANAIGAITSEVTIRRQMKIQPDQSGGFYVEGLAGGRRFHQLPEAEAFAKKALCRMVRDLARQAGTGETAVEIESRDHTVAMADGNMLFLERILSASLVGRPDLSQRK